MYLLLRWFLNTVALFVVVWLLRPHINATSIVALAIAALVLGLLNAVVRPVLFVLTFPITVITLGLFLIVLNAIMLEITAALVPGFGIEGFGWAMLGAIVLALVSVVTNRIGKRDKKRD